MRLIKSLSLFVLLLGAFSAYSQTASLRDTFPTTSPWGAASIMSSRTPTGFQFYINGSILQWGTGASGLNSSTHTLQNNTASTGKKFSINSSDAGALQLIDVTASSAVRFIIASSGNIGIGNTTPSFNLDVTGTGRFTSSLTGNSFIKSGGTASQFLKADGSVDANLYLTANQTITISGDGAGSGTTSIPFTLATVNANVGSFTNASITVDGKGRITAVSNGTIGVSSQWVTTGSNIYYSTGNVGIGTTSPTAKLHVAGGDALINTLTAGLGNGGVATNTAFGFQALNAVSTASENTGVGYQALNANVTGIRNTAFGTKALLLATGTHNTAFGMSAGSGITTGYSNTALGYATLTSTVTGTANVAVGSYALQRTSGQFNTAVGYDVLNQSLSGSYNIGIGYQAFEGNVSTPYNIGIGVNSLYSLTGGTGNIALGFQAGYGTGGNMASLTDDYGVFLGYQASRDVSILNTTTLTNIVAIGKNAKVATSNSIALGGTGSDAMKVGIGTASPNQSAILDLTSVTKGFLPPRMTTVQKNAVSTPVEGLIIHDSTTHKLNYFNGTSWVPLDVSNAAAPSQWVTSGNNIYYNTGNVGINTNSPITPFHVNGNFTVGNTSTDGGIVGVTQITTGGGSPISNRLTFGTDGSGWKFAISKNQNGSISDLFTVQDNGSIGIGTTSPTAMLHVAGNITSPGAAYGSEKFGIGSVSNSLSSTALGGYSTAQSQATAIGANANASGQYATSVGESSYAGAYSTAIGRGSSTSAGFVALGYSANAAHGGSIVIGNNLTSTAPNQFLVGSSNAGYGITDVIIGTGVSSGNANSYGGLKIKTTSGSGTDINGADLKIAGGSGTGAANGGYISFLTTSPGTSGSTVNTEQERLRISPAGNVGIGTNNPQSLLAVNGTVTAKKVVVTLTGWPDFVFHKDYKLPSLEDIENYIKLNKHLPDMPTAAEVEKTGVDVGDTQALLLKKIEEMTLLIIEQNKRLNEQEQRLKALEKK